MTYRPVDLLRVMAWGETVGYLAPDRGDYAFQYEPRWSSRRQIAPLHMPVRRAPFVFRGLNPDTYKGLPPVVADALPDRFGNALVDAYLARLGVVPGRISALDRLAYLGHRTMGALTFEPETGPADPAPSALDMRTLTEEARRVVEGRIDVDDVVTSLADIVAVGTSAGGARAKAVIALDETTGEVRAGNIPVEPRFEQWLIKFDGVAAVDKGERHSAPFCRIEYAYARMASIAGVQMSATRLLVDGPLAHFLTRRFDRDGTKRLHMASLCGLAHLDFNAIGAHDYAQLFATIDALGLGEEAREQAFRRMAFNVAAVNHDDHTKNTAFLMDEDGRWQLAPAYDLTYSSIPGNRWLEQHLMGVDGRFEHVTTAQLLALADRFAVPHVRQALSDVRSAIAAWPDFARDAGVPEHLRRAIGEAHRDAAI